jgi:nicotinamide mononucleotide (NMN) deamidase PncC
MPSDRQRLGPVRHSVASTMGMVVDLDREARVCTSDTGIVGPSGTGIVGTAVVGLPDTDIVGPSTENCRPVVG